MLARLLDHAVSIAAVTLAVCAVFALTTRDGALTNARPGPPSLSATYRPGDSLTSVGGFSLVSDRRELLVVMRSNCRFCASSMSFYRQVAERRAEGAYRLTIVAVAPEDDADVVALLDQNEFGPDRVVKVRPDSLRVRVTPTLVLVNASGVVERIWEGALSEADEQEVLEAVLATDAS